jgi:hypothetical protein
MNAYSKCLRFRVLSAVDRGILRNVEGRAWICPQDLLRDARHASWPTSSSAGLCGGNLRTTPPLFLDRSQLADEKGYERLRKMSEAFIYVAIAAPNCEELA